MDLCWRVPDGVNELVRAFAKHGLNYDDSMSARFVRLRRIRELVAAPPDQRAFPNAGRRDRA
jgi:hypothetical protein